MRSSCQSFVLMATPLLLGVAVSEAAAQPARPPMLPRQPMMAPNRPLLPRQPMVPGVQATVPRQPMLPPTGPITTAFTPGMGMFQPSVFTPFTPGLVSPAFQMPFVSSGMSAMPYPIYIPYPISYGNYGNNNSGYGMSTSPSYAPSQPSEQAAVPTAGEVEVSGPLNTPPPRRAIIRVRLPRTWANVSVNGQNVDSMGKTRTYVTPELPAATTFQVSASWQDNGQSAYLQKQVTLNAGQIGTVDFTAGY